VRFQVVKGVSMKIGKGAAKSPIFERELTVPVTHEEKDPGRLDPSLT